VAISFASAKLTLRSVNSCSIFSSVRFDKSFSVGVSRVDHRYWVLLPVTATMG
jgi:hypothetical protein